MGRVLTFADPDIIRLAKSAFVPLTGDDWYQRRRKDDEGDFFRKLGEQGPRQGEGTRQGIYLFTAGGKLLMFRNHNDPEVMRTSILEGLKEWQRLPAQQRAPGAIKVEGAARVDKAYERLPPKGGLVVTTHTRILDKASKAKADVPSAGGYCQAHCDFVGGERSARDHLWLTEEEWKSLVPAGVKKGDTVPVSERIAYRLFRFHLVDNTRGEAVAWKYKEVCYAKLNLVVADVNDSGMTLSLDGVCLLAADGEPERAKTGFDLALRGTIHYNADKKVIDRFDMVALGEHWGSGPYTPGARPGRMPLGIAFELAGDTPAGRIPPQGARWLQGYMEAEKHR